MFSSCKSLDNVEIPSSVVLIDESAFEDCKSLSKIIIPFFVNIKNFAFGGCDMLDRSNIPASNYTIFARSSEVQICSIF